MEAICRLKTQTLSMNLGKREVVPKRNDPELMKVLSSEQNLTLTDVVAMFA